MTALRLAGALLGLALLCAGVQPAAAQTVGADAAIDKVGGGTRTVGQSVSFTVTARNGGSMPLPGTLFTVTDTIAPPLTAPVTASGANWACTVTGTHVSCHYTGGMVLPGAILPPITITAMGGSPGPFSNCARVVLGAVPDSNPGNNEDCAGGVIQSPVSQYDVGVEKAVRGPSVVGQTTTFTLSPFNVGPSPVGSANAVQVIDVLPANFSAPITASGPNWTCSVSGQMVTCTYVGPSVGVGGNLPVITITAMTKAPGPWRNCARIGLRGQDVNRVNNEDCNPGSAVGDGRRTDIGIRKTGPAVTISGQQATFTLSPFNVGPSPVNASSGIRVTDLLPANFVGPVTAMGSGWTCTIAGSGPYLVTCDWFGGPIPANGLFPPITIKATAKGVGGWSNCADIELKSVEDANEQNNHNCTGGEVRPGGPAGYDVDLTKTGPATVTAGQGIAFTLVVSNNGPSPVNAGTMLVVTDTVPPNFSGPMMASGNGWTCVVNPPLVKCTYTGATVYAAGQTLPAITISAVATGLGQVDNCALASIDPVDIHPDDNDSCINVEVKPSTPPDLSATKIYSGYGTNGEMNFILTATNQGPGDFAGPITFTDKMPAGLTPTTYFGDGWTCTISGQTFTCTWTGPTIHVGDSFPVLDLHAMPSGPGTYHNCAKVDANVTGWQDPTPANNTACADGKYYPAALTLTKSIVDDCYQNGNGVDTRCTFRITITNTGNAPWTGPVKFSDTVLPQNASFPVLVGGSPSGWGCVGVQPMICTSNAAITLGAGDSITVDYTVDIGSPIAQHDNCAKLMAPNTPAPSCVTLGGGSPPSLTIEKVVEQDCSGVAPNTLCKFVIRIFNTGSTPFIGQLTFTDLVSLSGTPISGVSYANPHPGGWVCTGIQPLTCLSGIVSIAPGAYVTVPLYMTVNGPVPANQNCATLTLPVTDGPSCVPMGSTRVDLGLDSNFMADPAAPGFHELSYWIQTTPQLLPGMQVTVIGSLTPAANFLPSGPIPPSAVTSAGWACSGGWASFLCSQTVTTGSFTNGFLVLHLRTSYPANAVGQSFTYVGAVTTNNNLDPDPTNNARTISAVLN